MGENHVPGIIQGGSGFTETYNRRGSMSEAIVTIMPIQKASFTRSVRMNVVEVSGGKRPCKGTIASFYCADRHYE